MQARTLDDCLNADEAMTRLTAHAGRLLRLQRLFVKSVPAALARTCRVANIKLGVVYIHAENGAVATKLRQISPSLSEDFRSAGEEVTEIQIKVQPLNVATQHSPPAKPAVLDEASIDSITRLSDTLPEGPLRAALERLLAHGRA